MEETVCAARAVWGEKKKRSELCVKYWNIRNIFRLSLFAAYIYSTVQRSSQGYECAP